MIRKTFITAFVIAAAAAGMLSVFAAMGNHDPLAASEMKNVTVIYKTSTQPFITSPAPGVCVIGQCQDI